jgi:hypothetical protein
MRALQALLDEWDALAERQEGRAGRALALLEAAEGAGPETKEPLWHRFLDTTRRPRYLSSLPARADRHRWAEAAFAAAAATRSPRCSGSP